MQVDRNLLAKRLPRSACADVFKSVHVHQRHHNLTNSGHRKINLKNGNGFFHFYSTSIKKTV